MLGQLAFLLFSPIALSFAYHPIVDDISQRVDVNTSRGPLFGFHVDYGAKSENNSLYYGKGDIFLGIPFVYPPVNDLRYQKPKPLTTLPSSPFNATTYAPACPQLVTVPQFNTSEDCLYLNIFTPAANSTYKYPVMIWIHGGFFKGGRAEDFPYQGAIRNLVSRGVVVVSIQYRLGVLGFFTTFSHDFVPNLGLLDQVEAIKWVREEIANFGGDPYRITLFGESAGSASVSAHTYSPLSQNLFQQAIMESGTALTCFDGALGYDGLSYTAANVLCQYTLDMWYSGNYTALKQCMMNLTLEQINNDWMPNELFNLLGWRMVQDNYFMPDVPRVLWHNRPNIPIIIGTNRDEWAFMELAFIAFGLKNLTSYGKSWFECEYSVLASYLNKSTEIDSRSLLEAVYTPYGLAQDDYLEWLKLSVSVFTGAAFTGYSTRDISYYLYNNNSQVYAYEFTYPSYVGYYGTKLKGYEDVVPHGAELPFVWMRPGDWYAAIENGLTVPNDLVIGDFFGETWTNFAKYGTPSMNGTWKPVASATEQNYLDINVPQTMKPLYRNIDRVIWNLAIPSQIGNWPPESPDYNNGTQPHEIPSDLSCVLSSIGMEKLSKNQQKMINALEEQYNLFG